jgi:hypothetical protein
LIGSRHPTRRHYFSVIALIAAHNEADIIGQVVEDLVHQRVQVYLLDDQSADDTADAARALGVSRSTLKRWRRQIPSPSDERYTGLRRRVQRVSLQASGWSGRHPLVVVRPGGIWAASSPGDSRANALPALKILVWRSSPPAVDVLPTQMRPPDADDAWTVGDYRLRSQELFAAARRRGHRGVLGQP